MPAKLLVSFITLLGFHFAFSQKVEFEHITTPEGLASTNVTSIYKDSYGYMWFGTFSGLFKYDGYNAKNYLIDEDPNSGEKSDVRCLFETKDRHMLIGTLYGLCIYNRENESITRLVHQPKNPKSISSNRIFAIYGDRKGNIWLGTRSGLEKFDYASSSFIHFAPFKDHSNQSVTSIIEDDKGNLLLSGGRTVCKFNVEKNSFEYIQLFDSTEEKDMAENHGVLCLDRENNLWAGNYSDGLVSYSFTTGKKEIFKIQNGKLKSNTILSITQDQEGFIWVGTDGSGLYKYKNHQFERFIHDPEDNSSLSGNAVYALYEGEPGVLWIGIFAGGVNVLKKDKKKFYKFTSIGEPGKKMSYKSVLSIAPAKDGKIWIGTDGGGLNLLDPVTYNFKYYTEENGGVCANKIKSMLTDSHGNLWCGTYQKGLCKTDAKTGNTTVYKTDLKNPTQSIFRNNIWSLAESRDGKIWIGLLSGGLDVLDPKTGAFVHNPLKILNKENERNSIFALMEDRKGRMWVGAETAGIICYDETRTSFVQFQYQSGVKGSLRSNEIRDIYEDSHGNMWFATMKGGLNKLVDFEKKLFENYTILDGLPSNNVLSILEDDYSNLWITTDKGITCFKVSEKKFINFDREDGVQSSKFVNRSKYKSPNGYMYFGGNMGLNMFHPDSIPYNNVPPPVVITDFKIFNHSIETNKPFNDKVYLTKSLSQTKELELVYQDFVFSIEFAALSFVSPLKNKYAYKLEGFDNEWTYVDADKRFVTYTNLNPGEYTFKVIAANNDGLWNEEGTSLRIIILPPWWLTWWFKALVLVLVCGGVLTFIYSRTKSIKERNKYLQEEVKKQTKELKEVNSDLLEKNADISRKTARILEQQDEILKQKDKLEQLNKTKDKLFSIIAHDLRNPVNALTVLSKMLKKEFPKASESGRDIIHNVEMSSERIKSLLLNLLEWAKSQTGNIKVDPIKVSVHKLVEENIQLHSSQASHKEITIQAEINISHFMYADYNMASTIVRNILNNNIKYTPRGGKVYISSRLDGDNRITLSFRDTGIGMPEETLKKLFVSNSTISAQGTEKEVGTGLGLIISKEFTELNYGTIKVESELGKGSTFLISLPGGLDERFDDQVKKIVIASEWNIPMEEEKLIRDEFKGKKILVVDDDEQVRNSVKHLLSDVFQVSEAINVKNAIAVSEEIFPDLIISDIMMPGETGISFCQSVKSNKNTCHIPVLLLTGQSSEETHLEGLKAGADAYITKPFDRKIFLTTINNLLNSLEKIKIRFSSDPEIMLSDVAKTKLDEELLSKALNFIDKNISDPDLNGDVLSKELGMSKSLLYIKIKNLTGQTVNEFIRIVRLKKSTKYLLERNLTISQISAEIGFNSPSYFTRSFTQHFGVSPKDYVAKQKAQL